MIKVTYAALAVCITAKFIAVCRYGNHIHKFGLDKRFCVLQILQNIYICRPVKNKEKKFSTQKRGIKLHISACGPKKVHISVQ